MRARVTARETVNPDVQCAGVLESADSRALKALGPQGREGSSPSSGTLLSCGFSERSAFAADAVVVAVQPEGVGSAHRDGALDVVGAVARASGAVVVADADEDQDQATDDDADPAAHAGTAPRLARWRLWRSPALRSLIAHRVLLRCDARVGMLQADSRLLGCL